MFARVCVNVIFVITKSSSIFSGACENKYNKRSRKFANKQRNANIYIPALQALLRLVAVFRT